MDRESSGDIKSALLSPVKGGERRLSGSTARLSRHNSVNSLKNDFVCRLPDKVRSGVDLESSSLFQLSSTSSLTQGEKDYYERQFATLKSFEKVDLVVESDEIERTTSTRKSNENF